MKQFIMWLGGLLRIIINQVGTPTVLVGDFLLLLLVEVAATLLFGWAMQIKQT
jgi:hypothetical protein